MKIFRFLLSYSKATLVLAVVAGIVSGASSTGLLALINTALADTAYPSRGVLWGFVGLCFLVPLARVVSELTVTYLGQGTIFDLRMQISRKILAVPLARIEELGAPKLMATLTGDIPNITSLVTVVPILCINLAILIGGLAYLGWLNWQVLLVVIVFIVIGIVSYQLPAARAMLAFRKARQVRDRLFDHFRALTEGSKELKLHHRRRRAFVDEALEKTATAFRRHQIRGQTIYTVASSWGQLLVFVTIGLVIFGLPLLPFFRNPEAETLRGYTLVLLYLMTPLQVMMNALPGLSQAEVALRRVEEMGLDLERYGAEPIDREPEPVGAWSRLELRGVTYEYQPANEDERFGIGPIDLAFEPGEIVFLTGGNGSGKTTLAKVIVGLYHPHAGEILIDGLPVTDENRESYRQHFTMVFSDNFLFESLLGLESPDLDERARRYLAELQIDDKVAVEDGRFSTVDLSQGQRKRLALLTAYMEDRPIYVFDEWAADQDPTFRDVFYLEILPELKRRGKTVIVISHDDRYYDTGDRLVKMVYGEIEDAAGAPSEEAAESLAGEVS